MSAMQSPAATADASPSPDRLAHALRPRHVTMITLGGIIGAGLLVGSSVSITIAGPAAMLSYALTGLLVLIVMRCLGEMAVDHPGVRSFAEFTRAGLGNWAGFSVGWLYWYFWVIVIPIEAIAGAKILNHWYPQFEVWQIGVVLMGMMTAVNLMSARSYGEFEFWFASIKVAAIIVFIAVCLSYALGYRAPGGPTFGNLTQHGGFAPLGVTAILSACVPVFFSMMGTEVVTIAAAESTEPARSVARMISSVIWRILAFYLLSVALIVSVVPWTLVKTGESPFTLALNHMSLPNADTVMSLIILVAVLSCLNSCYYVASRVLFALAEKGDAPQFLVKTNRRFVPARSVWLASFAGFLGVVAEHFSPDRIFAWLVNASGAIIIFIYILICLSQWRLRTAASQAGKPAPTLPVWLFPVSTWFAIIAMVAVLVKMAFDPGHRSEVLASSASIAAALLAFALTRAGKAGARP